MPGEEGSGGGVTGKKGYGGVGGKNHSSNPSGMNRVSPWS